MQLFNFRKSDSDRIKQLKIKANVDGLSKILNSSSKELEVRIEAAKALAEIGNIDALLALHEFSNMPIYPYLHDEIMNQLLHSLDSYVLSQTSIRTKQPLVQSQLITSVAEEQDTNKMSISCLHCREAFSKPIVMLNFEGGKTKLVNVCPHCTHTLGNTPPRL